MAGRNLAKGGVGMTAAVVILSITTLLFLYFWLDTRMMLGVDLYFEKSRREQWEKNAVHHQTISDELRIERDKALQKLRKIENLLKQKV
jgi:hypothetical protein